MPSEPSPDDLDGEAAGADASGAGAAVSGAAISGVQGLQIDYMNF